MKVMLNKYTNVEMDTAVAIGNFDGLHLGHQYLIEEMMKMAEKKGLTKAVFTFDNNTLVQFKTNKVNNILMSNSQKILLLENMGIELLYLADFTEKLMHMSPYDFIKQIIVEKLRAKLVVIGFNYKFGYKAQGDVEFLKKAGKNFGFEVVVIDPITYGNKIISSSYIRELINNGLVKEANALLGRPFTVSGTIVKGKGRGKGLGFATANLKQDTNYQMPKFGVYKTNTYINGKSYLSITNIGSNPTFDDVGFSIETHIIDFNKDIYGEKIEISLLDFIREEVKFTDKDKLKIQVKSDIEKIIESN
ncbi:bifunctional riboflavin kinase/FAD synthetase [Proteiniborus sp.]|uniref:bifunctional riboflavin kinase/FAD synthetase n=1 Tax=Proteiniborus sp. TaxID=2079015 RepID=UPI00331F0A2C